MSRSAQRDLFERPKEPQGDGARLFAEIVFDRPLDQAYTYAVPEELQGLLAVGKRILAPFGRGQRPTVGYCVRLTQTNPERSVKEIRQVIDEEALLTPGLLRLTRWIADYYLCGWGQVLNAVIPAGARRGAGMRIAKLVVPVAEIDRAQAGTRLTAKQKVAWERLLAAQKPLEVRQLAKLARCGPLPIAALVDKGFARRITQRIEQSTDRGKIKEAKGEQGQKIELNSDQVRAWAPLESAVRSGGFRAFLLHGVTGSGKTELYLRAIEEVLRLGKEALVLVPEISLTPQTIQRFRGRCSNVAVLHSHLGQAERGGQWRRVASGQAQVIVGARSGVFAPARRLGLIVVDEEHESSFKQESTPRYHARDVAVVRARLEDIPIILGSATPSLESWHNCQTGHYELLTLPKRVLDLAMPHVGMIDLRHEGLGRGKPSGLSPSLERAMRDTLHAGGQVMLLLNRRGFSTHIHCPACGFVEVCKFCDISLTFHRQREVLVCHYCGYEQVPPERCRKCNGAAVRYQGLGTEKLQAEIEERFPGYVVRRMDSDSMRRAGSHARVLDAFRNGMIHILLGTQMIAKGLDFPNVTLVGVVNADIGMNVPDFRSAERSFQLLSQVAGRTGRGPLGGKVLVQTFNPEHPSIALAAAHDYAAFVQIELGHRQAHLYPPFNRLVRVIIRSKEMDQASAFAERLAANFSGAMKKIRPPEVAAGLRVLGPAEAPVFRLKGYFRYHFQLQSASAAALHQLLRAVMSGLKPQTGVEYTVDVDPLNML
jgi:primosomal protein N' (replication factor Y)